jgi:hypothetical protein
VPRASKSPESIQLCQFSSTTTGICTVVAVEGTYTRRGTIRYGTGLSSQLASPPRGDPFHHARLFMPIQAVRNQPPRRCCRRPYCYYLFFPAIDCHIASGIIIIVAFIYCRHHINSFPPSPYATDLTLPLPLSLMPLLLPVHSHTPTLHSHTDLMFIA